VQDGGTQDFVLSKEAVYQTYLAMVTRQQAGGFTFSRPVLGKMVKRAFPTVPSIRRGPRGRVKQLYVGLIPRLIKTEGLLSTSQTAGGVLNLQLEEEDDEAELVSYLPPTGYTDEESIEEEAAARRRASFTTTTATSSSFTTSSSSSSSASSTNHRRGSVETTSTSTSSSTSSYSSPYSPLTGPDTSPPCLEQRRGSLTAAAATTTTSAATGCEDGAVEALSRCWFGDKATAPEITDASAERGGEDYQLALLVDALTTQQQQLVLGRRSPERRGRRLSVVEWAESIIPAGLQQLPTASPIL
jgi:hypothetical protein